MLTLGVSNFTAERAKQPAPKKARRGKKKKQKVPPPLCRVISDFHSSGGES